MQLKKDLKYVSAFLLPLGCIGLSSGFILLSVLLFIGFNFSKIDKKLISNYIKNNYIKNSCLAMIVWIVGIGLASIFNLNVDGYRQTWAYLERMILFFIVVIYFCNSINDKKMFFWIWLGICLSSFILSVDIVYKFILMNEWRPSSDLLGNPNKLGGYLILILPFIIAGTFRYYKNKFCYFGIIVSIVTFLSLIISGSRGALGGFIGAVFITFFIYFLKNHKRIRINKKIIY
ncbi:hypothetical protein [uncultured Phascolarctobacterium sp.]|uniref:hypothetical protein n=1 Tax=uncultured Phascolarctobacterium sp. TaxID=512296 RepID=UPI0027D99AFB|nr:hypothetical protein [uncultured Phascolarctobacterium sp.]